MKPFDLEKALAGEPVKLRDGSKAYVKYVTPEEHGSKYPLVGYLCDSNNKALCTDWTIEGKSIDIYTASKKDITAMWEEPRPRVQLDLPAPLKSLEDLNEVYCPILDEDSNGYTFSQVLIFEKDVFQNIRVQSQLDYGNLFATKEDAQEWLDAMRNARR